MAIYAAQMRELNTQLYLFDCVSDELRFNMRWQWFVVELSWTLVSLFRAAFATNWLFVGAQSMLLGVFPFNGFTQRSHNLEWIDTHALLVRVVTMICSSHLNVMQKAGWWGLLGGWPLLFRAVFLCLPNFAYWIGYVLPYLFNIVLSLIQFFALYDSNKDFTCNYYCGFSWISVLAIQLTIGVSDSEPSTELQEAMPALQQWVLERYLLMTWKKLFFARIECDCVSYILLVVYNSVNLSRSHTFCPSIYKCFELCLSGYFRCPVFIGQVFNRVHQDLSVIDMLASIGTKVCNLLINLGITKAFLIVPTHFCIFYLISIWSPCTYAKSSKGFLNTGDVIILGFLLVPDTWFGDQKLVPDSFCWAAYGCHG